MNNEQLRHDSFASGPEPFSDEFATGPAGRGTVTVISGVYGHSMPLVGMTVRRARAELEERMNISPEAMAVVDGEEADEDTVLAEGQVLNFVMPAGEKGSR